MAKLSLEEEFGESNKYETPLFIEYLKKLKEQEDDKKCQKNQ